MPSSACPLTKRTVTADAKTSTAIDAAKMVTAFMGLPPCDKDWLLYHKSPFHTVCLKGARGPLLVENTAMCEYGSVVESAVTILPDYL